MMEGMNPHPAHGTERRRWVRHPCHAGTPAGPVVAYTQGNLLAQPVRNVSAGGLCLVTENEPIASLSVELYNLRSKFACTRPARVVSTIEHPCGCLLVGAAFTPELTPDELNGLVARTNVVTPSKN